MTPEWLRPTEACVRFDPRACLPTPTQSRRALRRSRVRGAAAHIARAIAEDLVAEHTASSSGLLQRIDPRAKLVGMATLLIATTIIRPAPLLLSVVAVCVCLALASRLRMRQLTRAWLVVPLFSLVIVAPAALNLVTPGEAVVRILSFPLGFHIGPWTAPEYLTLTAPGLAIAARFVLRTTACVSLVLVTTATTRPAALLSSLRGLGVPRVFVMVLAMMYRYLTLLLRITEDLHLAKLSRTIGAESAQAERRWVASGAGFVFGRCRRLGDDVYRAMLSRGYDGEARQLRPRRLSIADGVYMAVCGLFAAMLLVASGMW